MKSLRNKNHWEKFRIIKLIIIKLPILLLMVSIDFIFDIKFSFMIIWACSKNQTAIHLEFEPAVHLNKSSEFIQLQISQ